MPTPHSVWLAFFRHDVLERFAGIARSHGDAPFADQCLGEAAELRRSTADQPGQPCELRGGWTWYTESAGWMYRLAVEPLLGLRLEGDKLRLVPCLPANWQGFKLRYRYRDTVYRIAVMRDESGSVEQSDQVISLVDDRRDHLVEV